MVDNRITDTDTGQVIKEIHDEAEAICEDIITMFCIRISKYIANVEEKTGATAESALNYLGLCLSGVDKAEKVEMYSKNIKKMIGQDGLDAFQELQSRFNKIIIDETGGANEG